MSSKAGESSCDRVELVSLYALDILPSSEAAELRPHLFGCAECREELARLRPIVDAFTSWPTDLLRPSADLQQRLASRIANEEGGEPVLPLVRQWREPEWEEVAPGIFTKILANDPERDRVTMLVRLSPRTSYPPHTHAGVEELHLLDGELWIEDRLLHAGDYNYGKPGASDQRVYSETGCTCVLITSPSDVLR